MRQPTPERFSRSIVMLGDMNPKIFHPAWFAAQDLIGKQEAEDAKIEVVHRDLSIFATDWVRMEVLRERFSVETTQQPRDESLRDLALGTFSILRHTPLRVMGINTTMEFRASSEEVWNRAGDRLAPKEIWGGVLDKPGMTRVTMREPHRRDGRRGYIDVRIEPSSVVRPGLFLTVNDHCECSAPQEVMGSDEMLGILKETWELAVARAEEIIYAMRERTLS